MSGGSLVTNDEVGVSAPHTEAIAGFVSRLRYEQIPPEVIERIRLLILDSLGCGLYGARLPWSRILQRTLGGLDDTVAVGVWGTDRRLSAPNAALVNGTQIQGFELDDVHRVGVLHVGAVTLPALLAVCSLRPGMTGRDFLTSAVAGYEIGPRVGICMGQEHIAQGWHSGATVGVFSAVAGASSALRLPAEATQDALGIAGTQAAGLMAAQYGAMVKRMHAGKSAQSGLYAALLAEAGFTGIRDVFESPYGGFCTTFSASQDKFDLRALSAGLGERFETMRISLKFYSCVGSNHTTLDAIRELRRRRPFTAEEVTEVLVQGSRVTVDHVGWPYRPEGLTSAQLNLPFCVATMLLEGDVSVRQFEESVIADPGRIALSRRVRVIEDPAITAKGSGYRHEVRVTVTLRDGTTLTTGVEAPRGSETHFATEAEIVEKFHSLADDVIGRERARQLRQTVLDLPDVPDVARLIDLLATTSDPVAPPDARAGQALTGK
jgi:2-methylcitrate dehydratase PrpD